MSVATDLSALLTARGFADIDGALDFSQIKDLCRILDAFSGAASLAVSAPEDAVAASYDSDADQGADAGLVFTAVNAGVIGNTINIVYADTATAGSETVAITAESDGDITVTVGVEDASSTADQVKAALTTANVDHALFTWADSTGNDGSGAVAAMTVQLADGTDAVPQDLVVSP